MLVLDEDAELELDELLELELDELLELDEVVELELDELLVLDEELDVDELLDVLLVLDDVSELELEELLELDDELLELAEDDVIPELIISNEFCGVVSPLHAVKVSAIAAAVAALKNFLIFISLPFQQL